MSDSALIPRPRRRRSERGAEHAASAANAEPTTGTQTQYGVGRQAGRGLPRYLREAAGGARSSRFAPPPMTATSETPSATERTISPEASIGAPPEAATSTAQQAADTVITTTATPPEIASTQAPAEAVRPGTTAEPTRPQLELVHPAPASTTTAGTAGPEAGVATTGRQPEAEAPRAPQRAGAALPMGGGGISGEAATILPRRPGARPLEETQRPTEAVEPSTDTARALPAATAATSPIEARRNEVQPTAGGRPVGSSDIGAAAPAIARPTAEARSPEETPRLVQPPGAAPVGGSGTGGAATTATQRPAEGRDKAQAPAGTATAADEAPERSAVAEIAREAASPAAEGVTSTTTAGGESNAGEGAGPSGAAAGAEPGAESATEDTGTQDEVEARMTAANPQAAEEEAEAEAEDSPEEVQAEAPRPAPAGEAAPSETISTGVPTVAREAQTQAAAEAEAEVDGAGPEPRAEIERTTLAETQRETDPDALQRIEENGAALAEQAETQRSAEAVAEEREEERIDQDTEAGETTATGGGEAEFTPAERDAGMSSVGESVGGGGGAEAAAGGGGGGGGGGEAVAVPEPAPDTASVDPACGLGAAATLRPAQAAQALDGVQASVSRTTQEEAASLQDQIPQVEVGGDGGESAVQTLPSEPGARRTAQAERGESKPTPAPEPLPEALPAATAALPTPHVSNTQEGTVNREDAMRVASSIRNVPTTDPGLAVQAGAAPALEMSGDADPTQMGDQQARLDETIAEQRAQGAADVAAPAGEHRVRVTRPREVLHIGTVAPSGAGGGAAGAGEAAATEEEIGIIAEEQQGNEVRTAVAKAQGDMATRRQEHRTAVAEEKAKTEQDVANLREENVAQQQAAKTEARAEVAQARSDWSQAQREELGSAHQEARREIAQGNERIQKEETQANEESARHIREGEEKAAEEKQKAERDAAQKKREAEAQAQSESDGIFGWIASKVSSFFDALKEGVTAIFDAAKKLVRAAIEAAKKLAVAVIEKARQAIVGLIRAVGAALIAIGDVLLAAFPNLRRKWRGFIERRVKAAEDRVNAIADALKKGVTKLLDALGKAFEFLLDAYRKAMLAVLDAAKSVVVGAINFAKKVAQALGTFLKLVKDVAAGPVQWIKNLGAAVVDGIKNHLWKAFQSAVKEWFNAKLEELLGIGTAIWNVLKQGGIGLREVGQMAFEALKAAIPPALIQLLIEKLVAMIVPAAGAVMVIIESIQAAWGAIQRIIAAIGKFVSFLLAVKGGGAGPKFAEMLAAAAIVVIDFVANWLLRKLRGPASKVGSKVKAIAQKIMAKIKAGLKKVGKALKKVGRRIKGAFRKGKKKLSDWRARRKAKTDARKGKTDPNKKKQDKEAAKRERLRKAAEAIRPQLQRLLRKGVSTLRLRAKLVLWRLRYRLSKLQLKERSVYAVVNPSEQLAGFEHVDPKVLGRALLAILREAEASYRRARFSVPEAEEIDRLQAAGLGAKAATPEDIRRMEEATRGVAGGTQEPLGTTRTESVEVVRRLIENKQTQVVPASISAVTVKPSAEDFEANLRRTAVAGAGFSAGAIHVPGARTYPVGPGELGTAPVAGLVSVVEPARIPGTEVTERMTEWMKGKGVADSTEITGDKSVVPATKNERREKKAVGGKSPEQILADQRALGRAPPLGPAAVSAASQRADVEAGRRAAPTTPGQVSQQQAAEYHRAEAINNIFVRLAKVLDNPKVDLITDSAKDQAIKGVAQAFRGWLKAAFPPPEQLVRLSEPEVKQLAFKLELAIMKLLHEAGRE